MKSYDRILRSIYAQPWAIQEEKLDEIIGFLELRAQGVMPSEALLLEMRAANEVLAARRAASVSASGAVGVLPIYGTITHRANMLSDFSGGTSTEKLAAEFRQMVNDPNVKAIVLDVDSPGGTVDGVQEFADEIYAARGKKPITAVANSLMASAAYWIGAQADEIVASPSAMVGSIGVYMTHQDISKAMEAEGVKATIIKAGKYKAEGMPFEPLSDDAKGAMQSLVDEMYGSFIKSVARGRKTSQESVRNGYGEGRVVLGQNTVKQGLADRVGTLDSVLAGYGASRGSSMRAEEDLDMQAAATLSGMRETLRRRLALASA